MLEYQLDCGRGEQHLSASLVEDDLVVYQGGTWLVDGVPVGDEEIPYFRYAKLETMQLVWTHNCEHGVLRGVECCPVATTDTPTTAPFIEMKVREPLHEVEFGPEQLIAKIPIQWDDAAGSGKLLVPIVHDMWVSME